MATGEAAGSRVERTEAASSSSPTTTIVCDNFVLDVAATTFNICKNCRAPKRDHVDFSRASDELKGKLSKRDLINATQGGSRQSDKACDNFRRDLSGTTFDMCVCGFPKTAHVVKALTHGAGNELAMKLTKKATTCKEVVPARQRPPPCQCAGCSVS